MKTCRSVSELSAELGVHRTGILCVERADKGSFFIGPEVLLHGGNPHGGLDIRYETAYRFPGPGLILPNSFTPSQADDHEFCEKAQQPRIPCFNKFPNECQRGLLAFSSSKPLKQNRLVADRYLQLFEGGAHKP